MPVVSPIAHDLKYEDKPVVGLTCIFALHCKLKGEIIDDGIFDNFRKISENSLKFSEGHKIVPNNFQKFPKITEDC